MKKRLLRSTLVAAFAIPLAFGTAIASGVGPGNSPVDAHSASVGTVSSVREAAPADLSWPAPPSGATTVRQADISWPAATTGATAAVPADISWPSVTANVTRAVPAGDISWPAATAVVPADISWPVVPADISWPTVTTVVPADISWPAATADVPEGHASLLDA